jgi:hypothetical protein
VRPPRAIAPAVLLAGVFLAGCGTSPVPTPAPGVTQGGVLDFATFARIIDSTKGIAEGVNIDGRIHPDGDLLSCGMHDYTSPEGVPGIDNQFGGLLPVIEAKVGSENLGALLAAAIADGQLLILMAVDGVKDPMNQASVSVRLAAGTGAPLLDANGAFLRYQTFAIDTATAPVSTLPGSIENGVLKIGPGDAVLPVRVLDASFNLSLHQVRGVVNITPDPIGGGIAMSGTLGGGIATADFQGIVEKLNIASSAIQAATSLVALIADQAQDPTDGKCKQLSAGLKFTTTPAFLLPE